METLHKIPSRLSAGSIGSPSSSKNCVSVGASYGNQDMAPFSGRGFGGVSPIQPVVTAMGGGVHSAAACVTQRSETCTGDSDICLVSSKSGTSMATPNVAGQAAVYHGYFKSGEVSVSYSRHNDG